MATLIIKDLAQDAELDLQAMRQIVGGSARARLKPVMLGTAVAQRRAFSTITPPPAKLSSSPLLRGSATR